MNFGITDILVEAQGIIAESPQSRLFWRDEDLLHSTFIFIGVQWISFVANSPTQPEFTEAGLRPKKNRFTLL